MIKQGELRLINELLGYVDLATTEDTHRFSDMSTEKGLIIFIPLPFANQDDVDISVKTMHDVLHQREGAKKEK